MAIWPFNRNKQDDNGNVPAEVKQYYQAERRERVGLAWLLAAGTLIVTVLVVLGLFFGGRWIYRQVTDDKPASTATEQQENNNNQNQGQSQGQSDSNNNGQTTNPNQPTPTTPQQTPQPNTDNSNGSTPTTGEVPRTGPDLDL